MRQLLSLRPSGQPRLCPWIPPGDSRAPDHLISPPQPSSSGDATGFQDNLGTPVTECQHETTDGAVITTDNVHSSSQIPPAAYQRSFLQAGWHSCRL